MAALFRPVALPVSCLLASVLGSWLLASGLPLGSHEGQARPQQPSTALASRSPAGVQDCLVPDTGSGLPFDLACLDRMWQAALASGDALKLDRDFRAVQARTPGLSGFCHDAAYKAVLAAVQSGSTDGVELLKTAWPAEVSCNAGLLHGAMDGLALSGMGPTAVRMAVSACSALSGMSRSDCMGGVGHASFQGSGSEDAAMRDCAAVTDPRDQAMCVEGVVKQMFRPAGDGSRPPAFASREAVGVLTRLCGQLLAVRGMSRLGQLQCFKASQEPFSVEADVALRTYRAEVGPVGVGGGQQVDRIAGLWREALDRCSAFGNVEGEQACRQRGGTFVRIHARNDDLADAVCALLDAVARRSCSPARSPGQ